MKSVTLRKAALALTAILGTNVTNAWALDSAREDYSDLFVWIFLTFCGLIVVAQLIPAIMMMLGLARSVKKESLPATPTTADQESGTGQYEV